MKRLLCLMRLFHKRHDFVVAQTGRGDLFVDRIQNNTVTRPSSLEADTLHLLQHPTP